MTNVFTLYILDSTLVAGKTLEQFPEIRSYEGKSEGDLATGMLLNLGSATLDFNFMPSGEIPRHLDGLNGFVSQNLGEQADLVYALSRVYGVQVVMGCRVLPDWDEENIAFDFMKKYAYLTRALLFYANSLWDYDGECLAQPPHDR